MTTVQPRPPSVGGGHRIVPIVATVVLGILLVFLVVLPVAGVFLASFADDIPRLGEPLALTLDNYRALWSIESVGALRNSLVTSLGGTALAVAIGGALAVLARRTDVPLKPVVEMAGIVPLFIPALVGALAWGILASPTAGLFNVALDTVGLPWRFNVYSVAGITFVFGIYYAPYAYLFVSSALSLMDPQLEEAGSAHGANRRDLLRRITIPAAAPAMLGAGLVSFVLMMENFSVPALLGPRANVNTISTRIYHLVNTDRRPSEAAAIGIILTVIMAVLLVVQRRYVSRRDYAMITGKGLRPKLIELGPWRWVSLGFAGVYILLAVVLPMGALLNLTLRPFAFIGSLGALFDPSTIRFSTLERVIGSTVFHISLRNSLLVGALVAVFGGVLAYTMSYLVSRTRTRGRAVLEGVAMAPLAIPALLMGMGFLWTWLPLPIPIYGTVMILALAYVARFMPQGFRSASSVIGSVHKDLEDSAVVCGSGRLRAFLTSTAPLMRNGIAATALLLVLLSMRELAASLFLFTSDTVVLSISIFSAWQNGNLDDAAAMSLMYSLVLLAITLAGRRWLTQRGGQL